MTPIFFSEIRKVDRSMYLPPTQKETCDAISNKIASISAVRSSALLMHPFLREESRLCFMVKINSLKRTLDHLH